jgi:hypothetical protein
LTSIAKAVRVNRPYLTFKRCFLVAAIETRSLPSSLAAARRGFTFYLADPSARLTSIAKRFG